MTNEELKKLEDNLWSAADKLRANSDLKSNEYSTPVLGLIFLKFADNRYSLVEEEIKNELQKQKNSRRQREEHEIALEKCGFYLPPKARYDYLLKLPEETDFDKAIKFAMEQVEKFKPELKDTLPKDEYFKLTRTDKTLLKELLRTFSDIPKDASGDLFGKIYEYFLGKFALAEGQGGGEFFTPRSVVRLIVEIIEPYKGKIFDPASGSGGMFVQSAKFVERRRVELNDQDSKEFVAYGQEKTLDTVKLDKMNLAVNGIHGDIRQANTYTEDPFDCYRKFDYVMANPPFNVDEVSLESVKDSKRFNEYGVPQNKSGGKSKGTETVPNANYLWINLFASSLNDKGRAGFVMANSASDARHSELEIRTKIVDAGIIEVMLTLPSNMFYTVTLPATLWFFNKGKKKENKDKVLFIDARNIFKQIDRAHREFTEDQVQNIATIVRLYHEEGDRYISLIDGYIRTIFQNKESEKKEKNIKVLQERIQDLVKSFTESKKSLETWVTKNYKNLTKEFQKKADEYGLHEKLKEIHLSKSNDLELSIEDLFKDYKSYTSKVKFSKVESSNDLQKEFCGKIKTFEDKLKEFRKSYDKDLRTIDSLYRFIDNELKSKNDIEFKAITNPKEVQKSYDGFLSEHNHFTESLDHALWMQERFPEAKYEDVTGLCKLADKSEVVEQDYSLNPGRYVGVVIEEDGMTEEEFNDELEKLNNEFMELSKEAGKLEKIIGKNIAELVG